MATRVTETLDLVLPAFKPPPKVLQDARVYGAGANALLGVIKETARAARACCWSVHNPGIGELASALIASATSRRASS